MSEQVSEIHELPVPAIDGYMEAIIGFANSGLQLNDEIMSALDKIDDQESRIIDELDESCYEPKINDRWNTAWHNIGRIAAIKSLFREKTPQKIGF